MPKVSIILTTSDRGNCLTAAIDGILNQTFSDFELIVCDAERQGSASSVVSRRPDSRVKTFRIDGPIAPRYLEARAIADLAAGEYLAIPVSPNLWASDQLERQVAHLDSNLDIAGILTVRKLAHQPGEESSGDRIKPANASRWECLNSLFLDNPYVDYDGILIRSQCYRDAGAFRCGLNRTIDAELLSRILIRFPIHIVTETPVGNRRCSDAEDAPRDKREAEIGTANEWNVLRENYLSISGFEDLVAIFPSIDRFRVPDGHDIKFLLAMVCLYESDSRSAWQLGLRWLYDLLGDEVRRKRIRDLYSFSYPDLVSLSGEFDAVFIEGEELIGELRAQGFALFDKVAADRDWLIAERQRLFAERQQLIAERQRLISEQSRLIAEHNAIIDGIYRSSSWRLTRPVRLIGQLMQTQAPRREPSQAKSKSPSVQCDAPDDVLADVPADPLLDPASQARSSSVPSAAALELGKGVRALLVIHQYSRTGAPYAVLSLARALFAIQGVRPIVISPEDGPIRGEFEREGFHAIVDPSLFSGGLWSEEGRALVTSFEAVIVTSLACFGFVEVARQAAKRLIWWIHETEAGFDTLARMGSDLHALFSGCRSIWLGSPLCVPLARKFAPQEKLHLLLYGCADRAAPPRPHRSGKPVFSIFGSVEWRKGQDVFLDAIEKLPDDVRRKALFRIIGSPLPSDDSALFCLKVRTAAALTPVVRYLSSMPSEELRMQYAETTVMVSASRDDPMPIVITEGLMFSKVCLCSSSIGHAQLIEDGVDGLIFPTGSAEELSRRMAWIIQNPNRLGAMGTAGRALYEKHFLVSAFVNNVARLLDGHG